MEFISDELSTESARTNDVSAVTNGKTEPSQTFGEKTLHEEMQTGEKPYIISKNEQIITQVHNSDHVMNKSNETKIAKSLCKKVFLNQDADIAALAHTSPINSASEPTSDEKPLFTKHVEIVNGEMFYQYECLICEKQFSKLSNVKRHVGTHNGEKPYHCSFCAIVYYDKNAYCKHLRTHSPYTHECPVCKRLFSKLCNVKRHIRTHTGEKPYQCMQCDKLFSDKGNLSIHMRIHSDEKPYQCVQCSKTFCDPGRSRISVSAVTGRSVAAVTSPSIV